MRRLLLGVITTGALLIITGTAAAVNIQTSDAIHPWQAWSDAAQVPTYAGTLPLTVAPDYFDCGGFTDAAGCTGITPTIDGQTGDVIGPPTVTTEIDAGQATSDVQATLYHELGQVFWAEYMNPADETQFMRIVVLPGDASSWGDWSDNVTINGVVITFAPFEWFAEGYRYCAEYGINQPANVNDMRGSGYPGPLVSFAAQQRQVCQLIDQVGVANGIATPAQTPAPVVKTKRKPRIKTRLRVIRPHRLRGSGFMWGIKRLRLIVR